ncbi:MAG: hypothetical protein ED859_01595 [Desulfuromonadales bacterium]|nr:MAG: hypothetical protein ED859_01595 [Desulfuromonadales bacterium]
MRSTLMVLLAALLCSCAGQVISRDSLLLANRDISFTRVREAPERFTGTYLLVGGAIAAVKNSAAGAELEILQLGLDSSDRPREKSGSEGRFLARSREFLDPLIYKQGRLVTLVGKVSGSVPRALEGVDYRYPVLEIRELHLWKPEDPYAQPAVNFGIGVGVGF